ncbi:hypothetical protein Back2_25710 [Nocardioides baekrokdamisoli]|uniref:Cytochrome c oxidase assembly protein n=1 Tax=Nocardioides baekrokdamisoli TaxID=1804624 RepID=A0A3G9J4D9_9ACTN|nr:hypothetical protein Back2_25710 [Nocardioides baekrokdamisoli]
MGDDALAPWSLVDLFSRWELSTPVLVGTTLATGLYLFGVWRLMRRGDRWPVNRTICWLVGVIAFFIATSSEIGVYDDTLLSVHMVQHMILSMLVPVFLALGAPVTLALRTLPRRPRGWLMALIHSRLAKVLTFAPLVFALYVLSPWALYYSGWYRASLEHPLVHEMMHVHLVVVGSLFFWPLLGLDPIPGRLTYPLRVLMTVLTLPFHAFLGVTLMNQTTLLGGDWYPELHDSMAWLPDPSADQHLAGGILWGSGDAIGLIFFIVLFSQWVRASIREAAQVDRRLDLQEARARAAGEDSDRFRGATTE